AADPAAALSPGGAVVGREFDPVAAAVVAGMSRCDAIDRMGEAVSAGVLDATSGSATGFRFTHALFQEATLAALPPGRRARLHLNAAAHLERENEGDPTAVLAELAHHHHRALAVGDPDRACAA